MKKTSRDMSFKEQLETYTPEQMEAVRSTIMMMNRCRYEFIDELCQTLVENAMITNQGDSTS